MGSYHLNRLVRPLARASGAVSLYFEVTQRVQIYTPSIIADSSHVRESGSPMRHARALPADQFEAARRGEILSDYELRKAITRSELAIAGVRQWEAPGLAAFRHTNYDLAPFKVWARPLPTGSASDPDRALGTRL